MDEVREAEQVRSFREEYRQRHVPPRYRGSLHLLFTFGAGSAVLVACVLQLDQVRPLAGVCRGLETV